MNKIDFVLLWVDDNDLNWRKEKNFYQGKKDDQSMGENRFRDWENLKYWFRGVEKYAPWVNNIYFITYGHLPSWLNVKHPKLKIINHKDYIPENYLPTFNSNVIELNLNRINELSEKFVLFNDDMFLINNVVENDFFENNLPKYECVEDVIMGWGVNDSFSHTLLNNMDIINRHFNKNEVIKNDFFKHFNLKYGKSNIRTFLLYLYKRFTGNKFCSFVNYHLPMPHLKSTFDEVWEKETKILSNVCFNKFRMNADVSHWVFQYWNMCKNNFAPTCYKKIGNYFEISNTSVKDITECIKKQKLKMICINDTVENFDFNKMKEQLNTAFEEILPEKSNFEI